MADIFISYKREDIAIVKSLVTELDLYGWSIWWDHEIPAGLDYDTVIESELKAAKAVVVLWTEQSLESRNVKDEANIGLERGVLIPVLFGNVRQPMGFRMVQAIQCKEKNKMGPAEISMLVNNIKRLKDEPISLDNKEDVNRSKGKRKYFYLAGIAILFLSVLSYVWYYKSKSRQTDPITQSHISTSDSATFHIPVNKDIVPPVDSLSLLTFEQKIQRLIADCPKIFANYKKSDFGYRKLDMDCNYYSSKFSLSASSRDTIMICDVDGAKKWFYNSQLKESSDSLLVINYFKKTRIDLGYILANYKQERSSPLSSHFYNDKVAISLIVSNYPANNYYVRVIITSITVD